GNWIVFCRSWGIFCKRDLKKCGSTSYIAAFFLSIKTGGYRVGHKRVKEQKVRRDSFRPLL
ncbi:MAG: hypothetical protein KAJ10_10515, partial [Thermodesulfovibrionia bacterium]|nr:hypothetical protein [Thermodesulfovibrionia bacterium]